MCVYACYRYVFMPQTAGILKDDIILMSRGKAEVLLTLKLPGISSDSFRKQIVPITDCIDSTDLY